MAKKKKYRVDIIESEAGWGQSIDETLYFETETEAIEYCKTYNNKHNPPMDQTPNWYIYARYRDQEEYGMLR